MKPQKLKGTRDLYPEQKRIQNYIFNVWRQVAESYGYIEIDTPILEAVQLYNKSGQEIPEQMYTLTDKSGRKLALRPETTPSIARMVASKPDLSKPIKWYSISRCLRYEQPQAGRLREFFQFNIDVFGTKSIISDAELITTAIKIMLAFKLSKKDFFVRISNRKLMEALLKAIKIPESKFKNIYRLVDKLCKVSKKDFKLTLKDYGLNDKQINDLLKLLATRNIKDLKKYNLDSSGKQGLKELTELFDYLKYFKVIDYCKLDLSIMRGLDYYDSNVFEVFDSTMEFRAIAGGGRYDNLVKNIPGVGYGMGDIVLELFLKKKNKLPKLNKEVDYYIAPVSEKENKKTIEIAETLRKKYIVEIDLLSRNLGKQLNYANSINAKYAIIVGKKDLSKKEVTLRGLKTGKEKKISLSKLKNQ